MGIASDIEKEITIVKEKFTKAGFLVSFTNSERDTICQFEEKRRKERNDVNSEDFFEEKKKRRCLLICHFVRKTKSFQKHFSKSSTRSR